MKFRRFCLKMDKTIRLYETNYFVIKTPHKRKLQQIASNYSFDIHFIDFMKRYKDYTKEPHSFLVNDTTLSPDNPLRFWNNFL